MTKQIITTTVPQQQTIFQQSSIKTCKNKNYLYDEAYSSETDSNLHIPANKELQTSTDSGYTNSEGHFTTNNSSELSSLPTTNINRPRNANGLGSNSNGNNPQYYSSNNNTSTENDLDCDTSDSSLNEADMKLVKLITNQIRMKKINLEAFIDDDDEDEFNVERALAEYEVSRGRENYKNYGHQDEGEESDCVGMIAGSDDQQSHQRLSTILEVSCESESPLKKTQLQKQLRSSGGRPGAKKQQTFNIYKDTNEAITCQEEQPRSTDSLPQTDVLDVDSIPIGVKPTNKMSFEELLEESLKKQDQLDMEQQKNSSRRKPITKKPFLLKNSGGAALNVATVTANKTAAAKPLVAQQQKPIKEPEPVVVPPTPTEGTLDAGAPKQHTGPPRPFLKRGEGLRRFQSSTQKSNTSDNSSKAETAPKATKSNSSGNNNSSSLNQQLAQQQELIQRKIIKKSQSYTNMNQQSVARTTTTAQKPLRKSLESKSVSNLKPNGALTTKTTTQANTVTEPVVQMTQKLKPAVQFNATAMPTTASIAPAEPITVASPNRSDDELKEFETLEQYVDEHPSFQSSVSFVENVVLADKKQSNTNTSKANKFAYMLNLLNSNNSKKLADLLEEELNELSNTNNDQSTEENENDNNKEHDSSDYKEKSNDANYDDDDDEAEATSNVSEMSESNGQTQVARQRSSSSCSSSSDMDSVSGQRQRSYSASSSQSNSRAAVTMRKIKRITNTNGTDMEQELKKKYSCSNYKDDIYGNENADEAQCDETEAETENVIYGQQRKSLGVTAKTTHGFNLPKTSSRSNSQETLVVSYNPAAVEKKIKFDDKKSWAVDCSESLTVANGRQQQVYRLDYNEEYEETIAEEEKVIKLECRLWITIKEAYIIF